MKKNVLLLLLVIFSFTVQATNDKAQSLCNNKEAAVNTQSISYPGTKSEWKGYDRYDFTCSGRSAIVVVPHEVAQGRPWIWRPAFFGAFSWVDEALLAKGFHVAFLDVTHFYGSPRSVKWGKEFYDFMCATLKLSPKVTLEGLSRGGFYCFNWAATYPENVACMYVDAPVCDMVSWPSRKRAEHWNGFLNEWNVKDADVDHNFKANVLQILPKIRQRNIPIIGVCGDADKVVPFEENFKLVRDAYQKMGGIVELIVKPGVDHHPHSLENPEPIVDFIIRHQPNYEEYQVINYRSKLTNAFHKFETQKVGCIAFLGGSITQMVGWRQQIIEDFKQRFPQTKFKFIEAGIGSTGSIPHAFRMNHDVFEQGIPDLMFVEAAVNDYTNTPKPDQCIRGMEGIIRHARMINPKMDLVMMHFMTGAFRGQLNKDIIPDVMMNHERIANYYSVTSINCAYEINKRLLAGEFDWKFFGGTHPSWGGHKFYTAAINKVLDWSTLPLNELCSKEHELPKYPLDRNSYFPGKFLAIDKATKLKGFKLVKNWTPEIKTANTRVGFTEVPMLVGLNGGDSFELHFSGRVIGYFGVCGPESGIITYNIDGKDYKPLNTATRWSKNLYIPWLHLLADNLSNGNHVLKVKIKKGEKTALHIRNFVVLDNAKKLNRSETKETPKANSDYYFEEYKIK